MTAEQYIKAMNQAVKNIDPDTDFSAELFDLSDAINLMSNTDRLRLRNALEAMNYTKILNNLQFNYKTQEWI